MRFRVTRLLVASSLSLAAAAPTLRMHGHHGANPPALPEPAGPFMNRPGKPYSGTPIDVLTYHYDGLRTGWNPTETDLTPASVAGPNFGRLAVLRVDGNVLAQPLVVSNVSLPDGSTHTIVIVATGHNSVYAFDEETYAVLWQVNLGPSQSTNDVGCGDVVPEYGISSTPVILRSGNQATIYVVAAVEPSSGSFHTYLHALDLSTGNDVTAPVEIAPSARAHGGTVTFEPQNQWSRAGLAYANGAIYLGIGSHCDQTSASGWVLKYDPGSLALQASFHTESPSDLDLGSVWMTGFAPAIDGNGNIFVVTGNGGYQSTIGQKSYAMSALSLAGDLKRVNTSFTPADWQNLSNNDADFGSGGIMLLPPLGGSAPPVAVTAGKWGTLYLLNQTHLGGLQADDKGVLDHADLGGGVWGGPAFYGSPNGPVVYAQGDSAVLNAYTVSNGPRPHFTQHAQGTSSAGYGGSLPVVSSNGTTAQTGVVFLSKRGGTVTFEAYDALALGDPLYAANAGVWSNAGNGNPFVAPIEANGRVYVPAYKTVTVFGLFK